MGAPEPSSLSNTEQLSGSEESRGEQQSSYPCRQLLNPYDLRNGFQVCPWEVGEGDDGDTRACLTAWGRLTPSRLVILALSRGAE